MFRAALPLLVACPAAFASDACTTRAIETSAEVAVSDGTSFSVRTLYQSRDAAAYFRPDTGWLVVDGPITWSVSDDDQALATDAAGDFVLGHQLHAMLLAPETLAAPGAGDDAGRIALPAGTHIEVREERNGNVAALAATTPDGQSIGIKFRDWRPVDGTDLPHVAVFDDGQRRFTYQYTLIRTAARTPDWFWSAVPAPALDEVGIYRLHRELLLAHCAGDAGRMAELSAESSLSANRGALQWVARDEVHERFVGVFANVDYEQYIDLQRPVVHAEGDTGWIAVNPRAIGRSRIDATPFDTTWSWIMLVRRVGGRWLNAGNASSAAR